MTKGFENFLPRNARTGGSGGSGSGSDGNEGGDDSNDINKNEKNKEPAASSYKSSDKKATSLSSERNEGHGGGWS